MIAEIIEAGIGVAIAILSGLRLLFRRRRRRRHPGTLEISSADPPRTRA